MGGGEMCVGGGGVVSRRAMILAAVALDAGPAARAY